MPKHPPKGESTPFKVVKATKKGGLQGTKNSVQKKKKDRQGVRGGEAPSLKGNRKKEFKKKEKLRGRTPSRKKQKSTALPDRLLFSV